MLPVTRAEAARRYDGNDTMRDMVRGQARRFAALAQESRECPVRFVLIVSTLYCDNVL